MTWTMYDSTSASDIPVSADAVAGYVDGRFAWSVADWARFATPRKLRIATQAATNDGHALDVETFDATPEQAPGWVRMRVAAGVQWPIVYCNRSTWPDVRRACAGLSVRWWIATLDRTTPFILAGASATQYAGSAQSGGHYDLSLTVDDFFSDVIAVQGGPGAMGGKINPAPFGVGRLDVVVVARNTDIYRTFSDGGAGGIDNQGNWFLVDGEHTPSGGFYDVDWTWDNLNRMCVLGFGNDGVLYLCVIRGDGGFDQFWSPLPGITLSAPASWQVTTQKTTDAALRTALRNAVDNLP